MSHTWLPQTCSAAFPLQRLLHRRIGRTRTHHSMHICIQCFAIYRHWAIYHISFPLQCTARHTTCTAMLLNVHMQQPRACGCRCTCAASASSRQAIADAPPRPSLRAATPAPWHRHLHLELLDGLLSDPACHACPTVFTVEKCETVITGYW